MKLRHFANIACLLLGLAVFGSTATAKERELRVGVYANEPKVFVDPNGKPAGILIDILERIASLEGWKLTYLPCTWQECLDALQAGRLDLMPDVAFTEERNRRFDFHRTPALSSWSQVFARKGAPIASVFDLEGKRVAVLNGSIQETGFTEMLTGFGVKVSMLPVQTYNEAFSLVNTGAADAAITNNLFGEFNAARYQLLETPVVFLPAQLFFATRHESNGDLLSAIDRHLEAWQQTRDSVYFQILKKWRGKSPQTFIPHFIWQSLAALAMLLLLLGGLALFLRWRVKTRTRDLLSAQARTQAILDAVPDLLFEVGVEGHIYSYHTHRSDLLAVPPEAFLGRKFGDVLPPEVSEICHEAMREAEASGTSFGKQYALEVAGAEEFFELSVARMAPESGQGNRYVVIARNITERKQAESREQHNQTVLKMLADKVELKVILDKMLRDVEAMNPDIRCSILLLDSDGQHLRHGAAPNLPDFYIQALDGMAIGPEAGSCGAAAYTRQRVIVEDIRTHPFWVPYLDLANLAELGSCWSQPIISGEDKVLGSFAIYHRHPSTPTPADLKLIDDESLLAALAIEKSADAGKLQLAASVFSHAREAILITDADGTIIEVNETFCLITGYGREEVIGQNPRILKSGRQTPDFYVAMWKSLLEKKHWHGEIWNQRKNGEVFAELLTISAVCDAAGKTTSYVALFTDITMIKEHQRQLEHIAHYDVLTNLPNRVLLADRLQQAMSQSERRKKSVAVAYLDLDGFKAINDSHGHDVGDQLLIALAQRMKEALRDGDTLARIGGDEFVAVLVDLEKMTDCEPVLKRLLQAASDPVTVGDTKLQVSASIGVTLYPQDAADADQLMRHADQAMYVAKQAGKNRYHLFDVRQDTAIKTQRESLEHIRRALDLREFVLYYQPKVNMKTGAVIGAEALIRWQHPERGLLPPAVFLPIIESHPISVELGEWVIDTALAQTAEWQATGLNIPVSVNVGARQLQEPGFAARLSAALARHPEVKPGWLELEILETSAMEDISEVSAIMHACRELGVSFALDDFGTGYSSLTYLKRLPAELLKIDQSFVRDMLEDPDDRAIVTGVIGLAAAFKRQVIAEGVETIAHGTQLLAMDCMLAQGYGIARPMPAPEMPAWMARWKPDAAWTE